MRGLDIQLAEGGSGLTQVARVGTQDHHLTPRETRSDNQGVQVVDLCIIRPDGTEGIFEPRLETCQIERRSTEHPNAEVVEPQRCSIVQRHVIRTFVQHIDTKALEHWQHGRQGDLRSTTVDLESTLTRHSISRFVEIECHITLGPQLIEHQDVGHTIGGREVLLVRLGEGGQVGATQPSRLFLITCNIELVDKDVLPESGGFSQRDLKAVLIDDGERLPRLAAHNEVQTHQL